MENNITNPLKLENQLCFPLYACAKEFVKQYRPLLEELELTYTQYIVMMVIWEEKKISVKEIGKKLYLDSGTLTPVLKSLESKGYVNRYRSRKDERVLIVEITDEGVALRDRALEIPGKVSGCVCLDAEESKVLYNLLYKVLGGFTEDDEEAAETL